MRKNSNKIQAWAKIEAFNLRMLNDSPFEAGWDEQKRPWDAGEFDADRLRAVYRYITESAQATAEDRGFSDQLVVQNY